MHRRDALRLSCYRANDRARRGLELGAQALPVSAIRVSELSVGVRKRGSGVSGREGDFVTDSGLGSWCDKSPTKLGARRWTRWSHTHTRNIRYLSPFCTWWKPLWFPFWWRWRSCSYCLWHSVRPGRPKSKGGYKGWFFVFPCGRACPSGSFPRWFLCLSVALCCCSEIS